MGDSSILSFLQSMRIVVENTAGSTTFTADPIRYTMTEPLPTAPPTTGLPCVLPARETAQALIQSYFTSVRHRLQRLFVKLTRVQTQGIIEVIDRRRLQSSMDAYYGASNTMDSTDLCLVYLVLAIGLVLQPRSMGMQPGDLANTLSPSHADHAELLFKSAKFLGEYVSGFEDGDLWSVQALCLMAVYQMMVSRWNAAYVCIGEKPTILHIIFAIQALTCK